MLRRSRLWLCSSSGVILATGGGVGATTTHARSSMSSRDNAVEVLAHEVFSLGNKHLKTVEEITTLPEGLHSFPEIAFIGKPSSGKSSIIGALCHNRKMGRSGSKPGTTTKLEFFNVGDSLLLVDTPGYGAWGKHRGRTENILGITLMRRYIALRKRANLQRIYWVMECTLPGREKRSSVLASRRRDDSIVRFEARDEEMAEFLAAEKVPFTVLLTKTDRLRGSADALRWGVNDVWSFFHSDSVPVIDVCAHPFFPERHDNIPALMNDLVHHCTLRLGDSELTLRGIRSLSYLPPTAADIIAAEERYPFEAHVLPMTDDMPVAALINMHNEKKIENAKLALRGNLTELQVAKALKLGVVTQRKSGDLRDAICQPENPGEASFASRPTLRTSDAIAIGVPTIRRRASAEMQIVGKLAAPHEEAADVIETRGSSAGVSLLKEVQELESTTSSVVGVPVPRSMVPNSARTAAVKLDKSGEAYADLIESQGYSSVIRSQDEFFVAKAEAEITDKSGRLLRPPSQLQKNRQLMLKKYVKRERKDRGVLLDAQGYTCPWLGHTGGDIVRGLNESVRSAGGSMVRDLKRTGFGGHSLSPKTLKNRGRATKKVGFWAT